MAETVGTVGVWSGAATPSTAPAMPAGSGGLTIGVLFFKDAAAEMPAPTGWTSAGITQTLSDDRNIALYYTEDASPSMAFEWPGGDIALGAALVPVRIDNAATGPDLEVVAELAANDFTFDDPWDPGDLAGAPSGRVLLAVLRSFDSWNLGPSTSLYSEAVPAVSGFRLDAADLEVLDADGTAAGGSQDFGDIGRGGVTGAIHSLKITVATAPAAEAVIGTPVTIEAPATTITGANAPGSGGRQFAVLFWDEGTSVTVAPNTPADWTELGPFTATNVDDMNVYYTDVASPDWQFDFSGAPDGALLIPVRMANADTAVAPVADVYANGFDRDNPHDLGDSTTTFDNGLLLLATNEGDDPANLWNITGGHEVLYAEETPTGAAFQLQGFNLNLATELAAAGTVDFDTYNNRSTGGGGSWRGGWRLVQAKVTPPSAELVGTATVTAVGTHTPASAVPKAGKFATASSSGQDLPALDTYTVLDYGTPTDPNGLLTYAAGVYTPQVEGYALVIAESKFEATHNNRHNIEQRIVKNGAAVAGAFGSDYSRNNNNDLSWQRSSMVAHFNGTTDTFSIEDLRDSGSGTPAGAYTWTRLRFVQLTEGAATATPFGHYGTPTAGAYAGTGTVDSADAVTGWDVITETDTAVIELQPDTSSIRLKDTTRPYLVLYGLPTDAAGTSRTSRLSDVTLAGTRIPHSGGHAYQRQSSCRYAVPEGMALVKPAAATDDVQIRVWLEEALASASWGTFAAYGWTLSDAADRAGVMVIALPDTLEYAVFDNDTAGQTMNTNATLDLEVFETQTDVNGTKFTRDSATAVTVPAATSVLGYAGVAVERTAASGSRFSNAIRWEVEGTDRTLETEFGQYLRGDQGSQDERNTYMAATLLEELGAGDTLNLEKFDPGTDDGANDVSAWAGAFLIDLDTLPVSGGGGPTTHQGAAALAGTASLSAAGSSNANLAGTAGVTGQATLAAVGSRTAKANGLVAHLATAELVAVGQRTAKAAAVLAGEASSVAAGTRIRSGTAALTGTASLVAAGSSSSNTTATASLSANAVLTGSGRRTAKAAATLTSSASLVAAGSSSSQGAGAAVLAATASLSATPTRRRRATATLTTTTSLQAVGVRGANATGPLIGVADLVAVGRRGRKGAAALAGTASIAAGPRIARKGTATLAGTSSLAGTGSSNANASSSAVLASTATLAAAGARTAKASSTLEATAVLAGVGQQSTTTGQSAVLASSATLTAAGSVTRRATAVLASTAELGPAGTVTRKSTATLTGQATVTAAGTRTAKAEALLETLADLEATARRRARATALLEAVAILQAIGERFGLPLRLLDQLTATPNMAPWWADGPDPWTAATEHGLYWSEPLEEQTADPSTPPWWAD